MTDQDAFERLVAEETIAEAGPARPTDVAAVVRSVATESPRWRFRSMFSATKMLAGAAVIALFGAMVAAGVLTEQAQAPAPAADAAEVAPRSEPVEFQGRWVYGSGLPGGGYDFSRDDGWYDSRDLGWAPRIVEAGDSRLDGELTQRASSLQKGGLEIWNGAFRIENDGGAWQQRPMIQSVKLQEASEPMAWTAVFDGEGGYAGLTAIVGITRSGGGWDVEGVIIDAPLPEPPTILTRE